jgi:hypothetical protein
MYMYDREFCIVYFAQQIYRAFQKDLNDLNLVYFASQPAT